MAGRTLVVTNDFPPRTGGIPAFVLAITTRLPPGEVVVHTARQRGDREHDAALAVPGDPGPLPPCWCPPLRSPAGLSGWRGRRAATGSGSAPLRRLA